MTKAIFLVDGNPHECKEIVNAVASSQPSIYTEDSTGKDEDEEFKFLLYSIRNFIKSKKQCMITRFSGNNSVAEALGDECSDMIVTFSYNVKSPFFSGCPAPVDLARDLTTRLLVS